MLNRFSFNKAPFILIVLFITLVAFRLHEKPTIYIIGDSTVRNSDKEQWGWGTLIRDYFDSTKINISNQAMAGRSTRTFIKELEGAKLNAQIVVGQIKAIKPGKLHTYLH